METSGSKSCCCGSNGSALTPNSRASSCSSQKPSRTQSHQKQFSQIAGSRSSMREPPVRAQWWQSTVCWRNISVTAALRLSNSAGESVVTSMPSATLTAQASFSLSSPAISTTQSLQAACGPMPS